MTTASLSIGTLTNGLPSRPIFPLQEVQEILRRELEEAAEESDVLHDGWEPVLDSLRMVTVVSTLEDMFDFPLPPEKVVRKGGYKDVDDGVDDMTKNLQRLWDKHYNK
jgi:acyl carrier protein